MTKLGTKLSDEHKKNIGLATKKMWADGVFDSKDIRDVWRKTALSGIAKKAKDLDEWLRSKFGISYFSDCILENIRRNQRIIKRETRNRVESALKGL